MSNLTVERVGRRSYVRGNTYPIKDRLRAAGAHWDGAEKAWWIGSDETARRLVAESAAAPELQTYSPTAGEQMIMLDGNTYPVRDRLRALGGQWDAAKKIWLVPESQVAAAKAARDAAPKQAYRPTSCRACGSKPRFDGSYVANGVYLGRDGLCRDCRDEARMGY